MKNDLVACLFFALDTDLENTLQEFFHIIKINSGDIKSGGEEDSWRVHIGVKCFLIEHFLFHDIFLQFSKNSIVNISKYLVKKKVYANEN